MYIHQHDNWTNFRWDHSLVDPLLDDATRRQGFLYGRLSTLGFNDQLKAMADNSTANILHSSEIEGVNLNPEQVRSSIARHLGIDAERSIPSSHYIDGVVTATLNATQHYNEPLTKQRLCAWQAAFFPTGFSGGSQIVVGDYRSHDEHIVSGILGREHVHYVAPSPDRLDDEMTRFLLWCNSGILLSPILRSAIAHFWFVSIHPFEDGNGRLARIIADIFLARADNTPLRFYNIASEINRDKRHYYQVLERTQHGDGDITEWLVWYLKTFRAALDNAHALLSRVLAKSLFWLRAATIPLSQRQTNTLNIFLDGYEAKLNTKSWANINKCSTDTANRDIQDLVKKHILSEETPGAKRPSYTIIFSNDPVPTDLFTNVTVQEVDGLYFLDATFNGNTPIHERILRLDAERFINGDLSQQSILSKYCHSFLLSNPSRL